MESSTKLLIDLDELESSRGLQRLFKLDPIDQQKIVRVQIEALWENVEEMMSDDTLWRMFVCLAKLKNLRSLSINMSCGLTLPAFLLAELIEESPKLHLLIMYSVVLTGNEEDFKSLGKAVENHPALEGAGFDELSAKRHKNKHETDKTFEEEALQPFLVALAQACPEMRKLELERMDVCANCWKAISTSPHLVDVYISNASSLGISMQNFAGGLHTNKRLKSLAICECAIRPRGGALLAAALIQNTTLTSVFLDIDWGTEIMFGKPVASMLRFNKTLTSLHLKCRQGQRFTPAMEYAQLICSSLAYNSTLQHLALEFQMNRASRNDNSRLSAAFSGPLRDALVQNSTLQQFDLSGGRSIEPIAWQEDIQFHLQLNTAGRQRWMSASFVENPEQWFDALTKAKGDLSTTFYFLSLYPHLLCPTV